MAVCVAFLETKYQGLYSFVLGSSEALSRVLEGRPIPPGTKYLAILGRFRASCWVVAWLHTKDRMFIAFLLVEDRGPYEGRAEELAGEVQKLLEPVVLELAVRQLLPRKDGQGLHATIEGVSIDTMPVNSGIGCLVWLVINDCNILTNSSGSLWRHQQHNTSGCNGRGVTASRSHDGTI